MNILVIRLGAFGDLVQCCWAFQALRARHASDRLVLLTANRHAAFARQMPFFDDVIGDSRPRLWQINEWLQLRDQLNQGDYGLVYDLQRKPRTGWYYRLFRAKPRWIGAPPVMGALKGHNVERYLAMIGASRSVDFKPDFVWLDGNVAEFGLPEKYALLIPGSSAHLPHKRWPAARYAELANWLRTEKSLPSVLVGTAAEAESASAIVKLAPACIDLTGKTDLGQIAALSRRAVTVVGNDTGPTFLAAALGAPTLMLMSHHTDPARASPYGPHAAWLKRLNLTDLYMPEVRAAMLWR